MTRRSHVARLMLTVAAFALLLAAPVSVKVDRWLDGDFRAVVVSIAGRWRFGIVPLPPTETPLTEIRK